MIDYSLLIPAFNTEKTLPALLSQIAQFEKQPAEIYVVDDGSTDNTGKISDQFSVQKISYKQNRGKGFALRTGFTEFLNHGTTGYLLCLDADLQHPVSHIKDFISSVDGEPQFLIGSRSRNVKQMPLLRILSNSVTSLILSWLTGQKIKDSQCGFRLIDRSSLKKLELKEDGFQLESEMIIQAARLNIPIKFIDIPTIYNGNISHIHHVGDTYRFIKLILREIVRKR